MTKTLFSDETSSRAIAKSTKLKTVDSEEKALLTSSMDFLAVVADLRSKDLRSKSLGFLSKYFRAIVCVSGFSVVASCLRCSVSGRYRPAVGSMMAEVHTAKMQYSGRMTTTVLLRNIHMLMQGKRIDIECPKAASMIFRIGPLQSRAQQTARLIKSSALRNFPSAELNWRYLIEWIGVHGGETQRTAVLWWDRCC